MRSILRLRFSSGHTGHDMWVFFFLVLTGVGVVVGQGLVIAFGVMGLLAAGISMVWNAWSLEEVSYERLLPETRVFVGEELSLTVVLTNKKPIPLTWIRVADDVPNALDVVGGDVESNVRPDVQTIHHATSMAWYERVRWRYRIRCTKRGLYQLGPVRIESGDPFGFLRSQKTGRNDDAILVYPRVVPMEKLGLPAARPLGDVRGGPRIFPDPARPSGLRDYQIGDPLKIVDWKATAKAQQLLVRTYEPSTSYTVILAVAVDTATPYWGSYDPEDLERVVTAAASVASYSDEQMYTVGLFSNDMPFMGDNPMSVAPKRGPDQLGLVLEALANVRPYALGQMAEELAHRSRGFPFGATIVVATSFLPPELANVLGDLKDRGFKVVVMHVGQQDIPKLAEGILFYELRDYFMEMEEALEPVAG